nr:uncharacterized protein LOC100175611 [Ciona intestinalis]|eukprot:XP_018672214.2 uncharacterized protein LOC100175611 [Ciona intestinalis]
MKSLCIWIYKTILTTYVIAQGVRSQTPPVEPEANPFESPSPVKPAPSCGETHFYADVETRRVFTSPNYPRDYDSNTNCWWLITAGVGHVVNITFGNFDTEQCCDVLELYNYEDLTEAARNSPFLRLSGSSAVEPVVTRHHFVLLHFVSDDLVNRQGFTLTYQAWEIPEEMEQNFTESLNLCEFELLAGSEPQEMTSPNFPNNYDANLECAWSVTAPGYNKVINIAFTTLNTEAEYDYIEIFDNGNVTQRYSGDVRSPVSYQSTPGAIVTVTFNSDNSVERPGFRALYSSELGECQSPNSCRAPPTYYDIINNDVPYSPGCTFREMYNKRWICSSLFFNDFPYIHPGSCRTNIQLSEKCMEIVDSQCSVGNLTTAESYFPTHLKASQKVIEDTMANLTIMFVPSHETFCLHQQSSIVKLLQRVKQTTNIIIYLGKTRFPPPVCNFTAIKNKENELSDLRQLVLTAKDTFSFCRAFTTYFTILRLDIINACDFNLLPPLNTLDESSYNIIVYTKRMFQLLPSLLEDSTLPKCTSLGHIDKTLPPEINKTRDIPTNATTCPKICLDIMFLLDGSGSMNTFEFQEMSKFVSRVVETFNLTTTRVGVMQFSHWFNERSIYDQPYMESEIPLGQFGSTIQFKVALSSMRHHGYTSFTAHAIHKAVFIDLASSNRFTDPCTRKVIVVIMDGRSLDKYMLSTNANAARVLGVTMYAVGVSNYSRQELQIIANGKIGDNDRVYTSPNFNLLHTKVNVLSEHIRMLTSSEQSP